MDNSVKLIPRNWNINVFNRFSLVAHLTMEITDNICIINDAHRNQILRSLCYEDVIKNNGATEIICLAMQFTFEVWN